MQCIDVDHLDVSCPCRMETTTLVLLLYVALGFVMAGLGLSLTTADFRRLASHGRGIVVALGVQMLIMPLLAFGISVALRLPPPFAVGLLLLAATPGSVSTNLYSHVFGGNVAFNVALTGLNTFLCAITLPIVCGMAMAFFGSYDAAVPVLMNKATEVFAIVLGPVLVGMFVRAKAVRFADLAAKPVKIASALVVIVFSVAAIVKEREALASGFAAVGAGVVVLNVLSLVIGYSSARLAKLERQATITVAFQAGIHNAIMALYVALAVLNQPLMALPAAVYSITMNAFAICFGLWVRASVWSDPDQSKAGKATGGSSDSRTGAAGQ